MVIHDKVFTMAELKQMSNDTTTLPTLRDSLQIRVKEVDKGTYEGKIFIRFFPKCPHHPSSFIILSLSFYKKKKKMEKFFLRCF